MYHSITIGTKNTWDDWRLIPSAPPTIAPPPVRKNLVELPGGNGSIDLTTFISGTPLYGVSTGSWEFVIADQTVSRDALSSEIQKYLHGKRFDRIILEDDPGWYYSGLLEYGGVKVGKNFSSVTISYTLDPFKKRIINGAEEVSL